MALVGFKLSGAWMVDRARTLTLEGDYAGALQLLGDLEGITLEQSNQLLQGTMCLKGVNDFTFEIENPEVTAEWAELWQEQVDDIIYHPSSSKFYRILAVRDSQLPSGIELDFLMSTLNCSQRELYQKYSHNELAEVLAKQYLPTEELIKVLPLHDNTWVYAVAVPKTEVLPWMQSKLKTCFQSVTADDLRDTCVIKDLRTLIKKLEACPSLSQFHHGIETYVRKNMERSASIQQQADQSHENAFDAEVAAARAKVMEFADNDVEYGWLETSYVENNQVKVMRIPKRALAQAACNRARVYGQVDYAPFSAPDLKMSGDDRAHTDAWLGTGLPLDNAYNQNLPETKAFFEALAQYQGELLSLKSFSILNRGSAAGLVIGMILTAEQATKMLEGPADNRVPFMLLVPHAGAEFDVLASKAVAVIAEQGGKLAHLVTVSRERDIPVIQKDAAMTKVLTNRMGYLDVGEGLLKFAVMPNR